MCLIFEVLPSRLPLRRPHSVVRFCLTGLLVFIGRIMSLLEALEEDRSTSLSFPASRDHLHPLTSVTLPGRMESLSSFSSLSFHLCFSLFFLFILTIARKGLIGPPG